PASLGIVRVEQALGLARRPTQLIDIYESGIQELVCRRRDERERVPRRERGRRVRKLVRRRERRQRIEAHLLHAGGIELALTGWRREVAVGVRQVRRWHVEPH